MLAAATSSAQGSASSHHVAVRTHRLGDGLVVRLSGVLDGQAVTALRHELLRPLPPRCRQVLIDAALVAGLSDEALAVLMAGSSWVRSAGCRFAFSAVSPALAAQIQTLELSAILPVTGSFG